MAVEKGNTYLNLIDRMIVLENKGKVKGDEVFRKLLTEYFFKDECAEKKVLNSVKGIELPGFFTSTKSLIDMDMGQFLPWVKGSGVMESLAGKVLFSKPFLQAFYRNHPPEITKMPSEIQDELIEKVKQKNQMIISAFKKMKEDHEADRQRTMLILAALVLKNIKMRDGMNFSEIARPASDIISKIFRDADKVFKGTKSQCSELTDDKHIKALVKEFCIIRKNSELSELADKIKKEFERYMRRAQHAFSDEQK